jgi:hypothetical protein
MVTEGRGVVYASTIETDKIVGALKGEEYSRSFVTSKGGCDGGAKLSAASETRVGNRGSRPTFLYNGVYAGVCTHDITACMSRLVVGEEYARIMAMILQALAIAGAWCDLVTCLNVAHSRARNRCACCM